MKKVVIIILSLVVLIGVSSSAYAHPGRLDKNGGHNCSAKSKQKGLCTGYHYHKKKK
ncbi:YHYH domain-containing protein [Paenibacillus sp. 11B]|uniref:YHYH domain-containing protein n=1 Tax=unclassified Paenibacillus TaxID=185978 RepID=UPI00117EA9E7|nr:YHYH domain-containing protein [Paenibacillus sp. 11B]MDN8592618.1 YHYH domain-containing protein [Paenibacillus sp. 11B]